MGAEKEHPKVPGGLGESFTEEQTFELRLEQSVGLQCAPGEREKQMQRPVVWEKLDRDQGKEAWGNPCTGATQTAQIFDSSLEMKN